MVSISVPEQREMCLIIDTDRHPVHSTQSVSVSWGPHKQTNTHTHMHSDSTHLSSADNSHWALQDCPLSLYICPMSPSCHCQRVWALGNMLSVFLSLIHQFVKNCGKLHKCIKGDRLAIFSFSIFCRLIKLAAGSIQHWISNQFW